MPNDPLIQELADNPRQLNWVIGNIMDDATKSSSRVRKSEGWETVTY